MIYLMPSICFLFLKNSTKFLCKFARSNIFRIERMFQIIISDIFSCPINQGCIYLSRISLPVFWGSDPESDIHTMFFWTIETNTTDEPICSFFEDKILEYFPISDSLFLHSYELELLLICGEKWTHIEILIRFAEFHGKFTDIHSSIGRKRNKNTSVSFDARSREIEMRIAEEGQVFYLRELSSTLFHQFFSISKYNSFKFRRSTGLLEVILLFIALSINLHASATINKSIHGSIA